MKSTPNAQNLSRSYRVTQPKNYLVSCSRMNDSANKQNSILWHLYKLQSRLLI